MRTLLALLLTCALVAVTAGAADAKSRKKKSYHSDEAPYSQRASRPLYGGENDGAYFERRLDAVPFGSKRWWQIFENRNLPQGG